MVRAKRTLKMHTNIYTQKYMHTIYTHKLYTLSHSIYLF